MNKKKIHVLYIITKLELGGAQKVCLSLFNELQKDHNVWLLSGTEGTLVNQTKTHKQVILLDALKREVGFSEITAFIQMIKEIKKLKKKYPDLIVHTHSTKAGYLGRWAALFAGVTERIHTVHGFGFHEHQSWLGYSIAYLLELFTNVITSHYVCVSSKDVETGIRLLPFFYKKYSLIRAAIDEQRFIPAQLAKTPSEHFIFGTVACFKKQKNLFDLLHAFHYAYTKNNTLRLEIIGDGSLRSQIEQWIKNHNLTQQIKLHGWQSDVPAIMQRWHAFALSSLWEGLPCAIVEARFLKLPVIAYNVGGMNDIISHGHNGLLYKPLDKQGLAEGMLTLSQDTNLYNTLRNQQDDLKPFTTEQMIKEHTTLYQSF